MDYTDILSRQRPVHRLDPFSFRHPAMARADRAKIFAPFAALRGLEESVEAQTVVRVRRRSLSEDEQEALERRLQALSVLCRSSRVLRETPVEVTVCWFRPDAAADADGDLPAGQYRTVTGAVSRFDTERRCMTVGGVRVPFAAIDELFCDALPVPEEAE